MLFQRIDAFFKKLIGFSKVVPLLGIAWYREDQWALLQKVSLDGSRLEATYEQWLKNAQTRFDQLMSEGKNVQKVAVDVVDMTTWCREMGRDVDSAGRTAYVVNCLHDQKMAQKSLQTDRNRPFRPRTRF